jgi:hypothetical protein
VLVGDSYAILLSERTGWDVCAEGGASFDTIVSLILKRDDWEGREAHLLWGVAHALRGTEKRVVETEICLLERLLKEQGARNVVVFTLDEMIAVHQSEEYQADSVHLNGDGYKRLYEQKGVSLSADASSDDNPMLNLISIYQKDVGAFRTFFAG